MQISKLHIHSYGISVVNKSRGSHDIEVMPVEEVPMTDGELSDAASITKAKGKDADGSAFESQVTTSVAITATWLPFGSNRSTPPDIRRGEKVAIYRFGDADKYYWTSLEYDQKLRKLETVIYTFSNTRVEAEVGNADTCYFIEVSTHDKVIQIHTTTSDGEPYSYDIVLNTKDGNFTIKDSIDNMIVLNSPEHQIIAINTDGSHVELLGEDINQTAVRDYNLTVGRNMTVNIGGKAYRFVAETDDTVVGGEVTNDFGASLTTTVASAIAYNAPSGMVMDGPDFKSTGSVTSGTAMNIGTTMNTGAGGGGGGGSNVMRGNFILEGSLAINGHLSSSSGASFAGSVSAPNIN